MSRGSKQVFFLRRHIDDQEVHEETLSITSHQGNANQTTVRCISHLSESLSFKRCGGQVSERTWQKGTQVQCQQECKLVQSGNSMEMPKKKIRTAIGSSNSTSEYSFKEQENTSLKRYAPQCSQQCYLKQSIMIEYFLQ